MTVSWVVRLDRLVRKTNRERVRKNVRAYRARKFAEGLRRVEMTLSETDLQALKATARPGETLGATVARLLTGNRGSAH